MLLIAKVSGNTRLTRIPISRAASVFCATAFRALPVRLFRKNNASRAVIASVQPSHESNLLSPEVVGAVIVTVVRHAPREGTAERN